MDNHQIRHDTRAGHVEAACTGGSSPPQGGDHDHASLLTERQVAALLNCTVSALRRWRLEGRGPRWCKIERLVRYRRSDIERWVESQAVETGMDPRQEVTR